MDPPNPIMANLTPGKKLLCFAKWVMVHNLSQWYIFPVTAKDQCRAGIEPPDSTSLQVVAVSLDFYEWHIN